MLKFKICVPAFCLMGVLALTGAVGAEETSEDVEVSTKVETEAVLPETYEASVKTSEPVSENETVETTQSIQTEANDDDFEEVDVAVETSSETEFAQESEEIEVSSENDEDEVDETPSEPEIEIESEVERNWAWEDDPELLDTCSVAVIADDVEHVLTYLNFKKSLPTFVTVAVDELEEREILDWTCDELELVDGADLISWIGAVDRILLKPLFENADGLVPIPSLEVVLSKDGLDEDGSRHEWTLERRDGDWVLVRNAKYVDEGGTIFEISE